MEWNQDYGFLGAYKYEVIREYFFHLPWQMSVQEKEMGFQGKESIGYWSGIVLSMGWEPNSNRCIWGFRRDLVTEFPRKFPEEFIRGINYLTSNLERMLEF